MIGALRVPVVYLFFLLFYLGVSGKVSAQNQAWLKRIGGSEENLLTSASLTTQGDIILTGFFNYGDGQMPLGNIILKSDAPNDFRCAFIAKLDGAGQAVWGQVLHSNRFGSIEKAVLDEENNIYISGRFHGELTFGSLIYKEESYTPQHFIAKYDSSGNPLWLKYIPGEVNIEVAFEKDKQNNLYLACQQGRQLADRVESTRLVLYKYDRNGTQLYERVLTTIPVSSPAYIHKIIVDSNQQPVILGHFMNSVKFGDLVFEGRSMFDAYLLKCNEDGSIKWATQIGKNELYSYAGNLAFDSSENIYVTGSFSNKSDKVSLFLKFDPEGIQTWQFSVDRKVDTFYMGGIYAADITIDIKDQSIILAGKFSGNVTFGNTVLNSQRSENEYDVFITKLKNDGEIAGAIQSTGDGSSSAIQLITTPKDVFYLLGHTISSTLKLSNQVALKPSTDRDGFLFHESLSVLNTNQPNQPVPSDEIPDNDAPQIIIPNIITPNNDDKNQYFEVLNLDIDKNNSLVIYNRWGKQVYSANAYKNDWEAKGLAEGSYYYVLYLEREKKYFKGWVNVVR